MPSEIGFRSKYTEILNTSGPLSPLLFLLVVIILQYILDFTKDDEDDEYSE